MKAMTSMMAATALMALTACDRLGFGGAAENGSANASANAAGDQGSSGNDQAPAAADSAGGKDPAGAAPAAAGGAPTLSREYVTGRWTDNGDCGVAAEFAADGRFFANNGAQGLWNLQGDRLTMTGSSTLTLQIVPIDQDTMTVVNPDGSLGRSTRC